MAQNNQNLQNTANQRSQELKPSKQTTGAGETSKASAGTPDPTRENRDVETGAAENPNNRAQGGNDSQTGVQ